MNILKQNFHEKCDVIKNTIEKCDFICLDTEFTGLRLPAVEPDNYFDDAYERYRKQRLVAQNYTLCQLGLACFTKSQDFNKYYVEIFNIFLFPRLLGNVNQWFACETASLRFLRQNNFDFNKFVYDGVPFVRRSDALAICQQIDGGLWLDDDQSNDSFIREMGGVLMEWVGFDRPENENSLELDFTEPDLLRRSLVVFQLSKMFPSIKFDADSSVGKLKVQKLRDHEIGTTKLSTEKLQEDLLGAAIILKFLQDSQKLIIGHNCFFDFLYLYEKFYKPLPKKCDEFKSDLHKLFPNILDTKHLALNMNKILVDDFGCKSTSLGNLYELLELKNDVKFAKLHQAHLELAPDCKKYENTDGQTSFLHEAGYDAFLCGLVFLRLSHLKYFNDFNSIDTKPLKFAENLSAVDDWLNRINLIQAATPYLNLIGRDPVTNRPHWLVITGKLKKRFSRRFLALGVSKKDDDDENRLVKKLSSFGQMDFRHLSSNRYLIAVGTQDCANLLLENFRNDAIFTIQRYNFFKHSKFGGAILWSSTILAATLSLFVVARKSVRENLL